MVNSYSGTIVNLPGQGLSGNFTLSEYLILLLQNSPCKM